MLARILVLALAVHLSSAFVFLNLNWNFNIDVNDILKSWGIIRFGEGNSMVAVVHDKEQLTFLEALKICTADGGNLAVLRAEEDYEELYNQLKKDHADGAKFWVGGTDGESNGKWLNMVTAEEFEYVNWLPGRPENNNGRTGYCMEAVMKNGELFMNDVSCDSKRNFMCEKLRENQN
jgi:hypothetical protein